MAMHESIHVVPTGSFVDVKIHREEGALMPHYASRGAAGADLHAYIPEGTLLLVRGSRKLIRTGITIELSPGFEAQIRPRSGLALNHGITVLNAPGTIDEDFRGEIGVILRNGSDKDFRINHGDRIAQMVIAPVIRANFIRTNNFTETERGSGGFGHTGA